MPHISGIFQLCLGCCSHSACGHEPSLLGHAGSGLQQWFVLKLSWLPGLDICVLGGVVFDKPGTWQDRSGRAIKVIAHK